MFDPLVSVVIPTFGRPEKLIKCIESVLSQTYKNIEIIIVDDNSIESQDRSATEIIMKNYLNNNNIKYIKRSSNGGGAIARNTGVNVSAGEFITFLDDDDVFHVDKIEKQVVHILRNDIDVSLCAAKIINVNKIKKNYECIPYGACLREFIIYGAALTPMIMLKKSLFINIGGFEDTPRFQDYIFMIKIHEKKAKVGIILEKLYTQYIHNGERISYSKKSKKGYEIKHFFERRNFSVLSDKERHSVELRQEFSNLIFLKNDLGLKLALIKLYKLFFKIKAIDQLWVWLKLLIKLFVR